MQLVGVDVGGSGIKGAVVDTETGELVGERTRTDTPAGFGREEVVGVIVDLVGRLDATGPVGVGFPAVVTGGVLRTDPTSHEHPGWAGTDLESLLATALSRPVTVLNDGDAAGLAEMRFGAAHGATGVVMVFTLGTGIGSAIFVDGHLVPNVELGRIYLRGEKKVAEYQAAARVRSEENLDWSEWGQRLNRYFRHIERVFSPDLLVLGGGASKHHDKFVDQIDVVTPIVRAQLGNLAGIVGAAIAARDRAR